MSKGSTNTASTTVPEWQSNDFQNLYNSTNGTTSADIANENIPGVTSQIQGSSQNILQNQLNPTAVSAPIAATGTTSWTDPGTAQSFMNPYESTALQSQVNLDRNSILNPELAQGDTNAAASSALGGDRAAVLRSNTLNNFNNTEANTIAQGENTAYNTGESTFEAEQARNLAAQQAAAQAGLGATASNIYANSAATQNALAGISAGEAPEQQQATQAGILASAPNQPTTKQTTTPNGGALGGILGGLLGGTGQLLTGIGGLKKGGLVAKNKTGIAAGMGNVKLKHKKTRRAPKKKGSKK